MGKEELLKLIGNGAYGSEIPDDDATTEVLTECVRDGLVDSEPTRMDDFFWLTPKGIRELLYRQIKDGK